MSVLDDITLASDTLFKAIELQDWSYVRKAISILTDDVFEGEEETPVAPIENKPAKVNKFELFMHELKVPKDDHIDDNVPRVPRTRAKASRIPCSECGKKFMPLKTCKQEMCDLCLSRKVGK